MCDHCGAGNPRRGANGVIAVQGGRFAGWSFYMTDGRLAYCHNWFDAERYYVKVDDPLPTGEVTIQYQFDFDGGAPGAGVSSSGTRVPTNNRPIISVL
ncbi:MAG: hypothetical protein O6951_10085 [Actinobacteria bacterium]|nr:hypothetical protein [Actinomycetota bacterium]